MDLPETLYNLHHPTGPSFQFLSEIDKGYWISLVATMNPDNLRWIERVQAQRAQEFLQRA